jgi:hypothetical protein
MATETAKVANQPSEFRVEKSRMQATLMLSNGSSVRGFIFLAYHSRMHDGPESVNDLFNGESGFFPFEVVGDSGVSTVLYNRDHVLFVELADRTEVRRDAGYNVATRRRVVATLSNGIPLRGVVLVSRPQGRDRLSDFARGGETFRYLEGERATYLVNVRHVLAFIEESVS